MGSTLTNGIYLPAEGERNCYTGLAANWSALDSLIGGYNAHIGNTTIHVTAEDKEAWNGKADNSALTAHTGNTTIHVTAEDKQAWNGKADSSALTAHTGNTTIHVTAADKEAWNGKADASALTAHTGDTTIHVTAEDKEAWNGKADSSALTAHTGDTTIHVTAEDKAKWDAVTSKADDSDVVHRSGNETVGGIKTFIDCFLGKNLSRQAVDLNDCVDANGGAIHYYYAVSNYTNILNKPENKPFILESKTIRYVSSMDYIYYQKIYTAGYNAPPSIYTRYYRSGNSSWSNWIKDTDKFVTTDTAQTVTGNKTFSSINGVEPSSLSLPSGNVSDVIDISSYISALDGTSNSYTVPANGWISIAVVGTAIDIVSSSRSDSRLRASSGNVRMLYPVLKNETLAILITGTTLAYARFIPCQGNI